MSDKLIPDSPTVVSGYGPDLVIVVPFNSEVKVKTILMIGGPEGSAPSIMKVWKNEENVDINIINEKAALQKIDCNENPAGDLEYPLNVIKFTNTG